MWRLSFIRSAYIAGLLSIAVGLLCQSTLQAAEGQADLTIHVVDSDGKPIWLAQATIYGSRTLLAMSTRSGEATFTDIPGASYRLRIVRYGFVTADVAGIAVDAGQDLLITVHMAREGLKQIATVTARPKPRASPGQIGSDATQAQLSDSLTSAISSLPGISTTPAGGISIRGYSPGQTTFAINGVPVSLPGTTTSSTLFNADVFSGASVLPGDGGGGTVNFQTRSPSLAWQGVVRAITASNHGQDLALQEAGTVGQVGLSYSHARNVLSDPLDGKSYLDLSGLFYAHDASAVVTGDALQARYEFSQQNTLLANAVLLDSQDPLVCRQWTGVLPCGYGPTNRVSNRVQSLQLKDSAQFGQSAVDVTAYANHLTSGLDQSGYFVAGVNQPSTSTSDSHQSGVIAKATMHVLPSFVLPLNFSVVSSTTESSGSAFGPVLPSVFSRYSMANASTSLGLIDRPRFSLRTDLGIQSTSVVGSRVTRSNGKVTANYQLTRTDTLAASFSPGNLGAPSPGFNGLSTPPDLQFICSSNIGIGNGPDSANQKSTQTSAAVTWTHSGTTWGSQVTAYRNVQHDAPVGATVSALGLDPALFGPGYVAQAQILARSTCGDNRTIDLHNLFFQVSGVADRAIYTGLNASVAAQLGTRYRLSFAYATTLAQAYGGDPLIFGPLSTVSNGQQLPNVPMHAANLSLSANMGTSAIALLSANYQSGNNANNLPPHVTFDAGALIQLQRGLLSVTMTNIGNVQPGPFATTNGSVPLALGGGGMFPTVAQPLAPRTLRVGYRFHLGLPERQTTFALPSEQYQRLTGTFSMHPVSTPFESGLPRDPFGIDRQSVYCGAKDVPAAQQVLASWKAYAESVEKSRDSGGYPESFPSFTDGAIVFNYVKNHDSYAILVAPAPGMTKEFATQFQPVEYCGILHGGVESEITARHLFMFPSDAPFDPIQNLPKYAPEVGLYQSNTIHFRPSGEESLPMPENFRNAGLRPPYPKGEPFAIVTGPGCSPEVRPAAEEFLAAVSGYARSYFDLHASPKAADGVQITPHTEAGGGTWLEIRTEDASSIRTLGQCMYVRLYKRSYVQNKGLDGATQPELNYSPNIGLYQIF